MPVKVQRGRRGKNINEFKKKSFNGFTIIEVLITIVIFGILLAVGSKFFSEYFIEGSAFWLQDSIYRRRIFLQRDAQTAIDAIINGMWVHEQSSRVGGLIDANDVLIIPGSNDAESDIIKLFDTNNTLIGRILTENDPNRHSSLIFDNNELIDGNERVILYYSYTNEPGRKTFNNSFVEIIVKFNETEDDIDHLINIRLILKQKLRHERATNEFKDRSILIDTESFVNLRK